MFCGSKPSYKRDIVKPSQSVSFKNKTRAAEFAIQCNDADKKDWYLPSIGQLRLISENLNILNISIRANGGTSIAKDWYWSSSEYSNMFVWVINFSTIDIGRSAKKGHDRVRPVRTILLK